MDLICNELSFYPLVDNSQIAELHFTNFIKTFRSAKAKYNFSHIRFPVEYSTQQVTESLNFAEWIPTISSPTLKNLILGLFKAPFVDDMEDEELEKYIDGSFEVSHKECPTASLPLGLSIAHIKSVPSLSLATHYFWSQKKIDIIKKTDSIKNDSIFQVYNISAADDINSNELDEWAHNYLSILIQTKEELKRYLNYSKYHPIFSQNFLSQLFDWKDKEIERYKYILLLMKDIEAHPFAGGMGQTENLRFKGKENSKRITQKDRLSYTLENDIVSFIACKDHYEFH